MNGAADQATAHPIELRDNDEFIASVRLNFGYSFGDSPDYAPPTGKFALERQVQPPVVLDPFRAEPAANHLIRPLRTAETDQRSICRRPPAAGPLDQPIEV
ncbi:MAG TPA: hypothetical protein VG797_02215 [Phycisphaerales bacterium]|nr:hypothetical protein [Phycisphaerales bacterium]